jgi:acyl-CoA thioesterase FadM
MSGLFVHRYRVQFSDTDAARIAYTGRIADMALDAIDAWYVARLGIDWFALNLDHGIGAPFVHMSLDFRAPLSPRDVLLSTVRLTRAGRSSLSFTVTGETEADGRLCFTASFVSVFTDRACGRSCPAPAFLAAAIAREAALGSGGEAE